MLKDFYELFERLVFAFEGMNESYAEIAESQNTIAKNIEELVQDACLVNPQDTRSGVQRPTINIINE